jgi:hypothetical protein
LYNPFVDKAPSGSTNGEHFFPMTRVFSEKMRSELLALKKFFKNKKYLM